MIAKAGVIDAANRRLPLEKVSYFPGVGVLSFNSERQRFYAAQKQSGFKRTQAGSFGILLK